MGIEWLLKLFLNGELWKHINNDGQERIHC